MRRGAPLRGSSSMTIENSMDDIEGGGQASPLVVRPPISSSQLEISADVSGKNKPSKSKFSIAAFSNKSLDSLRLYALILFGGTSIICPFLPVAWCILLLVVSSCAFGALASIWLSGVVLKCDDGTAEMRAVSDPIREGADGFLRVQYSAIAKFAIPLAFLIIFSYQFRPTGSEPEGVAILGNAVLGFVAALGFLAGAVFSAFAGYVSMWVAAKSNIRVASAARRSYGEALVVCFRGGAFSAVLNLTMCIFGVTILFTFLNVIFVGTNSSLTSVDVPMLLVGYGFGASFVALFMQLGGGIYTKAADVVSQLFILIVIGIRLFSLIVFFVSGSRFGWKGGAINTRG